MNVEAEIEDLKGMITQLDGIVMSELKAKNVENRRLWKKMLKLEKRIDYVIRDLWEQELFLVRNDVDLADRIDFMIKVTRKNQDRLEELVQQKRAKGGEK